MKREEESPRPFDIIAPLLPFLLPILQFTGLWELCCIIRGNTRKPCTA